MSASDVEQLVRSGYAHFNREREPPPMWHPDGEFVNTREDPDHATYHGIDAISGAAMDMELAHVLTIDEDGRTRRLEEFFDRAEALAAVDLEE
jgi:hypothetical protein